MTYRDISNYSEKILKSYNSENIKYFAEQAIIHKKYDDLKKIIKTSNEPKDASDVSMVNFSLAIRILEESFDLLDVQAVKILLEELSEKTIFELQPYISQYLSDLFENDIQDLFGLDDVVQKRTEILKLFLDYVPKSHVNLEYLINLSNHLKREEFENFCKIKEINLEDESFKDLNLKHYEIEKFGPLIKKDAKYTNIVDFILSRTYSEDMSKDQVSAIYQNLYNLHPISKEMLSYTAHLINENNDIKIIFGKELDSAYYKDQNVIRINSNFQNETIFNIESVAIHEIGHFVYSQLFGNETPLNFSLLKKTISELYNYAISEVKNSYITEDEILLNIFKLTNEKIASFEKFMPILEEYEKAAMQPIYKAAELLKLDVSEFDKFNTTISAARYFKDNSIIDLFYANQAVGLIENFNAKTSKNFKLNDGLFDNFYRAYLDEEVVCKVQSLDSFELSREEIINWAIEKYLPQIVSDLKLTPKQIHFLSRIADYVNRGDQILVKDNTNYVYSNNGWDIDEKYAELIVRSMELKSAGVEEANSFDALNDFYLRHVSPAIKAGIQESYQQKLAFFDNLNQTIGLTGESDTSSES